MSNIVEIKPLSVRLIEEWRPVLTSHGFEECSYPKEYVHDGILHGSVYFRNKHDFVVAVTAYGHRGSYPHGARCVRFVVLYGRARCTFEARDNFIQEKSRIEDVLRVLGDPEMLPTYIGDEEIAPIIAVWCRMQND